MKALERDARELMSVRSLRARALTLAEAVAELRSLMAKGKVASEAVDEFLATAELAPEAEAVLVRAGLVSRMNNDLHYFRNGHDGDTYREYLRFQPRAPHGRQAWAAALAIPHVGADGIPKPLEVFTSEDCAHLAGIFQREASGLFRRVKVLDEARRLLAKHGASEIGKLPERALRPLAKGIGEAWRP